MNPKTIFISYSWKTKSIANKIFQDLAVIGIKVIKDNFAIRDFESISDFMRRIKQSDYNLIILSEDYLKSRNCMFEILKLFEVNSDLDKTLPVLTGKLNIFNIQGRIEYIKFWENETRVLEESLSTIDAINSKEVIEELKIYKDISYKIGEFLKKISEKKLLKYEELIKRNYIQILEKIGIEENLDHLVELLSIINESNITKKLERLEDYEEKNGPNSFYYGIRASTFKRMKKYYNAVRDYELSIELEPDNYESLNNLGFLLDTVFNKISEAKNYYKQAIKSNPYLSVARLNLGIVYTKEDKITKAKEQYEEILEYEPSNEKAHNNLGNIYKSIEFLDLDKAEFHLKKALELNPKYVDGLINYANFLKVHKKQINEGNKYYRKAKKLVKNNEMKKIIDFLLKSDKG